jgi:hypothetical protein
MSFIVSKIECKGTTFFRMGGKLFFLARTSSGDAEDSEQGTERIANGD